MRTVFARRTGVAAIAAVLTLLGSATAAAADDTTGSISGAYTDSHGNPITGVNVAVWTPNEESFIGNTSTDDSGHYTVADIPPGDYIVEFDGPVTQFAHGQAQPWTATVFTVAAGSDTTVDETALPTGTMTGTLANADGSPAVGIGVSAFSPSTGSQGFGFTDDNGHWTMTVLAGDAFEVNFNLNNGLAQYAPGQTEQQNATIYPVAQDQTVTVDDQLLSTGTIAGQYTDSAGHPDANAQVVAIFLDNESANFAFTDSDGNYSMPVFAGPYNVNFFGSDNKGQYAFGSLTQDTAAVITVTPDATETVNDAQIATGTVTVTATDATTRTPIANFCATADGERTCSKGTGVAVVTNVRAGVEEVNATTSVKYLDTNTSANATVTAGQNTNVNIEFQPAAVIRTTIVDAETGAPVANACVLPFVPGFTVWPDTTGYCSNDNGVVKVAPITSGSYSLFVRAPDGSVYGDQWVGTSGGTGMEQDARVIDAMAGQTVRIPPIKLDHAGTITGRVTSNVDGTPLANATVGPNPYTPGVGATGNDVFTDSSGQYTLTTLGPYQWPIFSMAAGFADQWTGGTGNRYKAKTVQVLAGASVTNDIAMSTGATLHGDAIKSDGTPIAEGGYVIAYNSKTGDVMGFAFANADGTFSIHIEPGQSVRIAYLFEEGTTQYDGYYGGTSASTAQLVDIKPKGAKIHIVLLPGDNR